MEGLLLLLLNLAARAVACKLLLPPALAACSFYLFTRFFRLARISRDARSFLRASVQFLRNPLAIFVGVP